MHGQHTLDTIQCLKTIPNVLQNMYINSFVCVNLNFLTLRLGNIYVI